MIPRQKWVDHKFNLGINTGWTINVMSRIKDASIRIAHHVKNLSDEELSVKLNNAYSIKEHLGHLIDLESLWANRFNQFTQGVPELVHADMSNQKTAVANHNDKSIDVLLAEFELARKELIAVYDNLPLSALNHEALHPRIKEIMKPVDLLFFVAEHDNHHITSMVEIKHQLKTEN